MMIVQHPGNNYYLNCHVSRHGFIDFSLLQLENPEAPIEWIQNLLLGNPATLQLTPDKSLSQKLRHLFVESRNNQRIFGPEVLAFGYPLFQCSKGEDFMVAPLFLWRVELESLQSSVDQWVLKQENHHLVFPNHHLVKFLSEKYGRDWSVEFREAIHAGRQRKQGIKKLIQSLCDALDFNTIGDETDIIPNPGVDELAADKASGSIRYSAVLGIFPSLVVLKETSDLAAVLKETNVNVNNGHRHNFGLLPTDPHQESAFQSALQHRICQVTGAPGTGKSRIATNLIINALSNDQKCLVVSSRVSALTHLQKELTQVIAAPVHFLLKDAYAEKKAFLEMLRATAHAETRTTFDSNDWRYLLNKCRRTRAKLDERYASVTRKIFGTYSWTDTVGLFLKNNRKEGKELLTSQLKSQDFRFQFDEYVALEDGILHSKQLYEKVKTLQHPLRLLHQDVFLEMSSKAGYDHVSKQIGRFRQQAADLHHRIINKMDDYQNKLSTYFEHQFEVMSNQLDVLKSLLEDGENKFGKSFSDSFYSWVEFKSMFSKKEKAAFQQRKELNRKFFELTSYFEANPVFESGFSLGKSSGKNVVSARQSLATFENDLYQWRNTLPSIVQDEVMRLNSRTVNGHLNEKEGIEMLENELDAFISDINEGRLFKKHLENKMLTLPKRQQYLEEIINDLEETEYHLRDFQDFYDWQSHWLRLPVQSQKVVKALIKAKSIDWVAAFESWYFHHCLLIHQSTQLPQTDELLEDYVLDFEKLIQKLPAQIKSLWERKREKALASIRKHNRDLYQYLEGKPSASFMNQSLDQIIGSGFESILDLIPVIFCTPEVAAVFSKTGQKIFDRIIIEEAGMLDEESAAVIMSLGDSTAIFGDLGPHTEEGEQTLLEKAADAMIPICHLRRNYSNRPTALSEFNRVAFQVDQFQNKTSATDLDGIQVELVEGRFDEKTGTNEAEAQHVIQMLNDIEATPQRTFPSVGIACFTIGQRDLISGYLSELKQKNAPGAELIRQLERNGMGVYYIGNMRAEHFDVVIATLAFGAVSTSGRITKTIEQLNSEAGIQKIYTLTSSPLKTLHLLHSIPQVSLTTFLEHKEKPGLYLLGKFLQYASTCMKADHKTAHTLLKSIKRKEPIRMSNPSEDLFLTEVRHALRDHFDASKLIITEGFADSKNYIKSQESAKGKPSFVLSSDGFFANSEYTSLTWEQEQRNLLREKEINYIPLWSVKWWKHTPQQVQIIIENLKGIE